MALSELAGWRRRGLSISRLGAIYLYTRPRPLHPVGATVLDGNYCAGCGMRSEDAFREGCRDVGCPHRPAAA